ncbi:LapA family protein [Pseudomonas sp. efr-133-TYG-23]|uniref:LapA family protein n=1 Tax=Pseudomonas sp. efr-133-TYG-23 TaxID=3040309 RepID=UPI0025579069|nr:LapA family protein [Pseudomonas sp. efr-133-TYG-23]
MRGVKRVLLVLTVLVVISAVLGFVLENQQGVSLSFLSWTTMQMPVAVFVVIALIVGMLIGPLFRALVGGCRRKMAPAVRG